ncbi:hypothetical protein HWV62_5469, partial [Athelia sp. TMB]
LTYFQNKVDSLGLNEKYLDNVDKLIKNFNKLDLEFIAHHLTNKQWRLLRRDMNMVKRIDFGESGNWDVANV